MLRFMVLPVSTPPNQVISPEPERHSAAPRQCPQPARHTARCGRFGRRRHYSSGRGDRLRQGIYGHLGHFRRARFCRQLRERLGRGTPLRRPPLGRCRRSARARKGAGRRRWRRHCAGLRRRNRGRPWWRQRKTLGHDTGQCALRLCRRGRGRRRNLLRTASSRQDQCGCSHGSGRAQHRVLSRRKMHRRLLAPSN